MKLTDYAIQSLRLDRELRATSRVVAYAVDAFRHAGNMALVVLCSDLTPWPLMAEEGSRARIAFVALWALLMALINLVRTPALEAISDQNRDAAK